MPGLFLKSALAEFQKYKEMGDKVFAQLDDEDFYKSPDAFNNPIAVNIIHLHGNMTSRWTNFLNEDGEKEWRDRDAEFSHTKYTKQELLSLWNEGWHTLLTSVRSLTKVDLEKTVYIRTKPLTVTEAILRQLTHHASHVGQIIFLGKNIKGAEWNTLSIPVGRSKQFNKEMKSN